MNKLKTIIFAVVILTFASGTVFSQENFDINNLQEAVGGFSQDISKSVPFNSTIGLNWSDAYIGKLFPSMPPHFGVGLTLGFTTFGISSFKNLLSAMDMDDDVFPSFLSKMGLPMPAYTVDARIGGFILPFDIGFKVGYLPLDFASFGIDYLLIGFDVRYAVLDKDLLPVKVSAGLGYNYLKGGVKVGIDDINFTFTEPVNNTSHTMALADPKMGFLWGTNMLELKVQASAKLLIFTPYIGTGLGVGFSKAGYEFKTKLKIDGKESDFSDDAVKALEEMGISSISSSGFESIEKQTNFNMRLFGGIALNLAVFRLDLNAMYNMLNSNWGITLGTRFQL